MALAGAALAAPAPLVAGGMFLPGTGPHAQARAGAFVARADDPSTIAHNPAGFAKLDGTVLIVGANFVHLSLKFDREGRYELSGEDDAGAYEGLDYPEVENRSRPDFGFGPVQAIPLLSASTDFGRPELPFRVGFGVYAPQGYGARDMPLEVEVGGVTAPAPQRYDVIEQHVSAVLPSLAVAWRVTDSLDVGVRGSWGLATVNGRKTVWALRNFEEYPGRDATFTLEGAEDWFIPSFGLGLLYRPAPAWEVGAAMSSASYIRAKGVGYSTIGGSVFAEPVVVIPVPDEEARCAPGGVEGRLKACVSADLPMTATAAGRYIFRDPTGEERADVELDLRWEDWSSAGDSRIQVDGRDSQSLRRLSETINRHGYRDVVSARLGGSFGFAAGGGRLIVRAGVAHDTAAAPASFTRADQDGKSRTTAALGLAYSLGRWRFEAGFGAVHEPEIVVENTCQPPDGPTVEERGCDGTGQETPVLERTAPDPAQGFFGPLNQVQSPINAGRYRSYYLTGSAGVQVSF